MRTERCFVNSLLPDLFCRFFFELAVDLILVGLIRY